jgi:hypothetical protein
MIWPGGLGWHPLAHQPPESAAASRILCAIWQHADGGFHLNRIPNNTICLHGSTLPCRKATGFIILHWTQLCLFASRFTTTRPLNPRVILTWRTTTPPSTSRSSPTSMARLREIPRAAAFAWSPGASPLVVTGTRSGAVDADFSDETKLELWDLGLDSSDQGLELQPINSIVTESRYCATECRALT